MSVPILSSHASGRGALVLVEDEIMAAAEGGPLDLSAYYIADGSGELADLLGAGPRRARPDGCATTTRTGSSS
jgi:hypothetical protein